MSRIINSNCTIYREPQLKQTLIKYSNMSEAEIETLKRKIIKNLKGGKNENNN